MAPQDDHFKIPIHQKLCVGAVAGVFGTMCIFPLDTVKTRLQAQKPDAFGKLQYRGMYHGFKTILKQEGLKAMYNGMRWNLSGVAPEKALKLGANDYFSEKFMDPITGALPLHKKIAAGALAGFIQVAATNPMEIVKLNLQLQNKKPVAERQTWKQIAKRLGLRGMYRGISITWARDVPYSIIFFPGYSILCDKFADENGHTGIMQIISAGAIAGASAALVCTPADCIKTRFQTEGAPYKNGRDCFRQTVAAEGYGALFKGAVPRMLVTAPLFGIALVAFEVQKRYLKGEKLA